MSKTAKLIIQIPCFNEADSLPRTLAALPRQVEGFSRVEWMVIDDGSSDGTAAIAAAHGVHHVIQLGHHQGLAKAFAAGIEAALTAGADVIVNTDGDNQYCADDIPKLTALVLSGEADIAIGARPIVETASFSITKKVLQRLGSLVVRLASRTAVVDAPSGFRALSRRAAQLMHVHNEYSYTLETIIQAGHQRMSVASVPVRTNPEIRPSRLVKSIPSYVWRSAIAIIRSFATYRPMRFYCGLAALFILLGGLLGGRYLYLAWHGEGQGHVQSVILAAVLVAMGVLTFMIAILADLIAVNRKLLEKLLLAQAKAVTDQRSSRARDRDVA